MSLVILLSGPSSSGKTARPEERQAGWAVRQARDIHDGLSYAAEVDTTAKTPDECANEVAAKLGLELVGHRVDGMENVAKDLAPSGTLRASINLGNPVLAQGTAEAPMGVTVDIAREVAGRLGVPVEFVCFDAARKSFEAMTNGTADLGFLANEPARAAEIAFTAPYVLIEGVFAVNSDSALHTTADVDQDGIRIGVNQGSAYDLFLARTLQHATLVGSDDGVETFETQGLEAVAGIRQPLAAFVAKHPDVRLIDDPFMQIQQAVGTTKDKSPQTLQFLTDLVEELKANGFIAEALARANQYATVAPAAA